MTVMTIYSCQLQCSTSVLELSTRTNPQDVSWNKYLPADLAVSYHYNTSHRTVISRYQLAMNWPSNMSWRKMSRRIKCHVKHVRSLAVNSTFSIIWGKVCIVPIQRIKYFHRDKLFIINSDHLWSMVKWNNICVFTHHLPCYIKHPGLQIWHLVGL